MSTYGTDVCMRPTSLLYDLLGAVGLRSGHDRKTYEFLTRFSFTVVLFLICEWVSCSFLRADIFINGNKILLNVGVNEEMINVKHVCRASWGFYNNVLILSLLLK